MRMTPRIALPSLAAMGAVILMLTALPLEPARADPEHRSIVRIGGSGHLVTKRIIVGMDKSVVVELPREVRDVHVSNPKKLDAVVQSGTRVYLVGVSVGQANAFFFDKDGKQFLTLEVSIERDLAPVEAMLNRLMSGASIKLEAMNDNVVLTGRVRNAVDASRAAEIVGRFLGEEGDASKVVNMLTAEAKEQVLLKVTVAEMERNMMKRLGVNWDGNFSVGTGVLGFGSNPGFPLNSGLATLNNIINPDSASNPNFATTTGGNGIAGVFQGTNGTAIVNLRLLEQNGLMRTLAEPNLTAISGEPANFLAGGEFPFIVGVDDGVPLIDFKKFGVGLAFTPTVLANGMVNLKIEPEVSEIDPTITQTIAGNTIPGIATRKAKTTIELRDGQSFAIAGLLQASHRKTQSQLPWIGQVPVLGALFRSASYEKNETDLVIIVTARLVQPAGPEQKLVTPFDKTVPGNDVDFFLKGKHELDRATVVDPKHTDPRFGHIMSISARREAAPVR